MKFLCEAQLLIVMAQTSGLYLQGIKQRFDFRWQEQSTLQRALLAQGQRVAASSRKNRLIYTQVLLVHSHSSALYQGQSEVKLYLRSQRGIEVVVACEDLAFNFFGKSVSALLLLLDVETAVLL